MQALSELINPSRYDDPEWMDYHREIESYSIDKHVFKHTEGEIYRKGWEWTHCIYGLDKLGMIHDSHKALGVGAGREPVIFWLADRIKKVVATDLYGNTTWSTKHGKEASLDILENFQNYCPRPINLEKVEFKNADGTALPFKDNEFDFCWSLSSIEHFGGHKAAAKAMKEMARVTKSGGIIAVASEYLLLDEYVHPEFFTKKQVEEYIINASPALLLVDKMSWELPSVEFLIDQICIQGEGVHRRRRHVVLNDGNFQWTSFILFLRKT